VPGQDLAAPSLEGAGHASHLLGPGVPAVLDEAVDPATGQLGAAVEGVEVTKTFLGSPRLVNMAEGITNGQQPP
jgi:hypothetical protein